MYQENKKKNNYYSTCVTVLRHGKGAPKDYSSPKQNGGNQT